MSGTPYRVVLVFEPPPGDVSRALAQAGAEVVAIGDQEAVTETFSGGSADLCVVWAGESDAVEACARVRRTSRGAVVPVVAVAGPGTDIPDTAAALDAGADTFVDTRAACAGVLEKVETLLGPLDSHSPQGAEAVEEALAAAAAVTPDTGDPRYPQRKASGIAVGEASILEVIDRMEQSLPSSLAVRGGPAEAMDGERPEDRVTIPAPIETEEIAAAVDEETEAEEEDTDAKDDEAPEEVASAEEDTALEEGFGESDVSVEPAEPAAEPAEELVSGSLKDDPVWSLLARASASRASGVLVLSRGGAQRRLFLQRGEVVLAQSSDPEDRLLEVLRRQGRLSEEQYRRAAETIGESGRRAGAILVEQGFIAARELFPLVRQHYETLVHDSFSWREGTWLFEEGEGDAGERIRLDVPTAALVVEGIRARAPAEDVDAMVPADAYPVRLEKGICDLGDLDLLPEEVEILGRCDGTRRPGDMARELDLPDDDTRALLAGLSALGWVAPRGGDPGSARRDGTRSVSRDIEDLRVERARVADKLEQVEEGSYFAILGVAPDASGYEIRKAYRQARAWFAPERFAAEEMAGLRVDAEVIASVLEEAYEVLRDPALREAYREALESAGFA